MLPWQVRTFGCSHNVSDGEVMAGQLSEYGFRRVHSSSSHPQRSSAQLCPSTQVKFCACTRLVEDAKQAHLWLINTCTVKNPSQAAMSSLIAKGRAGGKALVVAGCVPQGDKRIPELQDLTLLGAVALLPAAHPQSNASPCHHKGALQVHFLI